MSIEPPTSLLVRLDTAPDTEQTVNLAGWIRRGGAAFAALQQPSTFERAAIGAFGGNVTWDDDEGDLAIDSVHLEALAAEQNLFTGADAEAWQRGLGLSDTQAADVLGVSMTDWDAMKRSGAALPASVARLCRAAARDPFITEAHIRAA